MTELPGGALREREREFAAELREKVRLESIMRGGRCWGTPTGLIV
jgi:hypothetical protein